MGDIIKFDPFERITEEELEKLKEYINGLKADEIGSFAMILISADGTGVERSIFNLNWSLLGHWGVELDQMRHLMAETEVVAFEEGFD